MMLSVVWTEPREGKIRTSVAIWSLFGSLLCAVALWYHAVTIENHASELHKIINYAPDAVIVCNARGQVLYANDAVREITGFTEDDLRKDGVTQLIPEILREAHKSAVAHAAVKSDRGLEGVNYKRVYPVLRKDGKMIPCLVSVGNVRHLNGPQFFAFISPVAIPGEKNTEQKTSLGETAKTK